MSRTNDASLRLSLVVKCLIVTNLSMHEDISIFDYGLANNKGIRYVCDVIKKTWSRYFLGASILSEAHYFRDLLEAAKF